MQNKFLFLLTLLSLLFSACAPASLEVTSTELNLYGFSEYVPAELIQKFETETGITVNYEAYATNEEMLAGLIGQPGKYDLIIPSDYAVEGLIDSSALLALDTNLISNYKNIDDAFLNPYFDSGSEKYSIPYLWGTTGIVYDKTKTPFPITSWEDLWRPELAGHVVVLDDAREMMGMALQTLGYDKNDTDPARLAEARDTLISLVPNIIAFDAETPEEYLLSGEAWVGVVYNGNAALLERENNNFVYVLPNEGAGLWFDNLAIPVDASHPDAALAFINFVLEPGSGALLIEAYPYSTPNARAIDYLQKSNPSLYDVYVNSLASNPPQEALTNAEVVKFVSPIVANLYEEYWLVVKDTK
jgi:spermidine/putrescine-binding protein